MSNIIKFHLQSHFQRFYVPNLCVFKIQNISEGVSFYRLDHALGMGLGGLRGKKLNSIRLAVVLSPP